MRTLEQRISWLEAALGTPLPQPTVAADVESEDERTHKFSLRQGDGQEIETVIMGYPGRFTACLSTQAGCALGCVFCATGQMGFVRHLTSGEVLSQIIHVQASLERRGHALRNLVLMGMGEPLHNYESVMRALELACDPRGLAIAPRHVTVNTVGIVPGIVKMAEDRLPYHLGVSLHASSDDERDALLPVNRRWPLDELLDACRFYCRETRRKIFFSWTLIAEVNDHPEQAERLAGLLAGVHAHVNLIRLNETPGYAGREGLLDRAEGFRALLRTHGVPCTIRQKRGIDVAAGCGQLSAPKLVNLRRRLQSFVP